MRPYRAYDKKWKRWIEQKDITIYGDGSAEFVRRGENGDKIEIVELSSGEIELMQSTGLMDKDCFFGDIAQTYYDDGREGDRGEVVWDDMGVVALETNRGTFPLYFYSDFKIIGNRWDNPELLEQ